MTQAQRLKLHGSVSRFVGHLHGGRGRNRPSKFTGLKTKAEVLATVTKTLVHRAGFPAAKTAPVSVSKTAKAAKTKTGLGGVTKPAQVATTRGTRRAAAVTAARLIKKMANQ
jgi:hypothetical protein